MGNELQKRMQAEGQAKQWCDKIGFDANSKDQVSNSWKN